MTATLKKSHMPTQGVDQGSSVQQTHFTQMRAMSSRHTLVPGDCGVAPLLDESRTVSAVAAEPHEEMTVSTALHSRVLRLMSLCLRPRLSAGSFCPLPAASGCRHLLRQVKGISGE